MIKSCKVQRGKKGGPSDEMGQTVLHLSSLFVDTRSDIAVTFSSCAFLILTVRSFSYRLCLSLVPHRA